MGRSEKPEVSFVPKRFLLFFFGLNASLAYNKNTTFQKKAVFPFSGMVNEPNWWAPQKDVLSVTGPFSNFSKRYTDEKTNNIVTSIPV
jgi:hypothetical protein